MHVSRRSRALTAKKCTKKRDGRAEVLVVYHLQNFLAKSAWKVIRRRWFVPAEKSREQRNISKDSPVFSERNFRNGNLCSISSKPTTRYQFQAFAAVFR